MNRFVYALPLALLLVSCGEKAEKAPANDNRNAEGDVLGGTITDDMLPLDTITSQSPPLRESPEPGASGATRPEGNGDDSVETPDAEPSSEPTPEDGA